MIRPLFPQLPGVRANELATSYASASVDELRSLASNKHPDAVFSATGGQKMSTGELSEFADEIRRACEARTPATIDTLLPRVVHPRMKITRHEASLDGVWAFLGCVLLPDVVRWRFGGDATPTDRFTGSGRGARNVFGRAWWRGELLFDERAPARRDPYWLVDELGEDEMTGIVERARAVSSRRVAVALARALVESDRKNLPRHVVARDAFKSYLRLAYFVEFDSLTNDELDVACQSLYRKSVKALTARETPPG